MTNNKKKRKSNGFYFDYSLLFVLIFIIGFGLTMIYSTSSYTAQIDYGDAEYYFKRQLIFSIMGLLIMAFVARFFDYHYLRRLALIVFIMSVVTVLLLKVMGKSSHGATRWLNLGFASFQPAEFVKVGVIIMTAVAIVNLGDKVKNFKYIIIVCVLIAGIPAALIYFISDNLSSAIIVFMIAVVMTFVAYPGYKIYIAITGAAAALGLAGYTWLKNKAESGLGSDFRFNRLLVWLNPEKYVDGKGYQTVQALYAIGSGGLFGKGLGKSLQKLGYIPESQNDMIFSIICEELGLFGATCLIMLFLVMMWRIIHIAQNAPDLFGSLLATGVFAHIAIQVVLNIAVVTNFIPNTGVSLPFISYGGSSAVFLLFEMGIVFNISSQIKLER